MSGTCLRSPSTISTTSPQASQEYSLLTSRPAPVVSLRALPIFQTVILEVRPTDIQVAMRAATTLMRLDLSPHPALPSTTPHVICDLGCGDGEFLIGLLGHVNALSKTFPLPLLATSGFGVDYNAALIETATLNAVTAGVTAQWLVYDFNLDEEDLSSQISQKVVSHMFVYLVPKQLALKTVRTLLMRLLESGVVICCHKFQPAYLKATREDVLMDLVVYERGMG